MLYRQRLVRTLCPTALLLGTRLIVIFSVKNLPIIMSLPKVRLKSVTATKNMLQHDCCYSICMALLVARMMIP